MHDVTAVPDHPFTTAEAARLGLPRRQLRTLLQAGAVRPVFRGVYVPGTWPDDIRTRARAAAHVLPPHCVVVDRSAAYLHDVHVLDRAELAVPPDLEVASLSGHEPTRRDGVMGGKRDLVPAEVMTVHGVRVTTPVRTACDVACLRGRRRAIGVLDEFRTKFGITEGELVRMLPRFAGRRGVTQLRELIPLSREDVDSPPESWIRLEIHDAGYPMPAAQVWAYVPGWGRVKMENAFEHLRIAVEFDGEEHHTAAADVARDESRRAALRQAGWIIIVVRRDGLTDEGRAQWLAELSEAYGARAPYQPVRRYYARAPRSPRRPRL